MELIEWTVTWLTTVVLSDPTGSTFIVYSLVNSMHHSTGAMLLLVIVQMRAQSMSGKCTRLSVNSSKKTWVIGLLQRIGLEIQKTGMVGQLGFGKGV